MSYIPLVAHTHFSLLKSCTKPDDLADRLVELNIKKCAITDFHTVSGVVQCIEKFKEKDISPILGSKVKIGDTYNTVLAKNMNGWKTLIKLLSQIEPSINSLCEAAGDIILIIGNNESLSLENIDLLREAYGSDLYLQVQHCHTEDSSSNIDVRTHKSDIKRVATPFPLYLTESRHQDNNILFCTAENKLLKNIGTIPGYERYVASSKYDLPSYEEMLNRGYTKEELKITEEIAEKCESIKITGKPSLPKFDVQDPDEYLRQLCRDGWAKKIKNKIPETSHPIYVERVKHELSVLQGAGLSPYFLIVADLLKFVEENGWLKGPGRGSAAGCLVSYLTDITEVDPIPYNLVFERFYNAGRNTKDKIALPDIDIDIPKHKREEIIEYIYKKYGHENCGQIVTFQTMKGRSVLKSVLGSHDIMSFGEMCSITDHIPDPAKIADELQHMKEEGEEPSIVMWALEHRGSKFKEYAKLDNDGKIVGPLAAHFEQAIRLEGLKTHASRHASGIVIAPSRLENYCQIMRLKEANVCGFEMTDAESIGLLKLDVLGLNTLDKTTGVSSILKVGDIKDDFVYN